MGDVEDEYLPGDDHDDFEKQSAKRKRGRKIADASEDDEYVFFVIQIATHARKNPAISLAHCTPPPCKSTGLPHARNPQPRNAQREEQMWEWTDLMKMS